MSTPPPTACPPGRPSTFPSAHLLLFRRLLLRRRRSKHPSSSRKVQQPLQRRQEVRMRRGKLPVRLQRTVAVRCTHTTENPPKNRKGDEPTGLLSPVGECRRHRSAYASICVRMDDQRGEDRPKPIVHAKFATTVALFVCHPELPCRASGAVGLMDTGC